MYVASGKFWPHTNEIGFETASLPTTSSALRDQLLNFAIVGGGREYDDSIDSECLLTIYSNRSRVCSRAFRSLS